MEQREEEEEEEEEKEEEFLDNVIYNLRESEHS